MAANQTKSPIILGLPLGLGFLPSSGTLALNVAASAEWIAFGFAAEQAKTLTDFWVYMSAMNGTLAANDLSCQVYSNTVVATKPNADLSSGGVVASAVPTAGTWVHFSGLSVSLTAGLIYWIVLKNPATTSGSSTTVYPTYQWFTQFFGYSISPNQSPNSNPTGLYGYSKLQTGNSGTSWSSNANQIAAFRIGYGDGTYEGLPVSAVTTVPSTAKVFNNGSASIEYGFAFTSPANASINVKGVVLAMSESSGIGPVEIKLYTGASTSACTLTAVTETIPATLMGSGGTNNFIFHFSSPVTIPGGTVCRVVLADTSSTGSSSLYFCPSLITIDSSCPAVLTPFGGTMVQTTTPSGTSTIGNSPVTAFTDSAVGTLGFMALLLDTNGEFASTGAGGGVPSQQHQIWFDPDSF